MGARIDADGGVRVAKSELLAISADLKDAIDLLPPLGALASLARGESVFNGIGRARLKESDRVKALKENLEAIGIQTRLDTDRLFIKGGEPHQGVVKSFDDHRIAMAFSIIGASKGGLVIEGAECVAKTYPDYWDIIKSLGVKLSEQPDR
jgi:3-phosphoshikimate 1-carboxyvinyltransferase